MSKKNKELQNAIKANHTLNKRYEFSKDGVNLNFNLNVKNKIELKTFIDLMAEATKEIEQDINNLDK